MAAAVALPSLAEVLGIRMLASKSDPFPGSNRKQQRRKCHLNRDQILVYLNSPDLISIDMPAIMLHVHPRYSHTNTAQHSFHACVGRQWNAQRTILLPTTNTVQITSKRHLSTRSSGLKLGKMGRKSVSSQTGKSMDWVSEIVNKSLTAESAASQKAFFYGLASRLNVQGDGAQHSKFLQKLKSFGSMASLLHWVALSGFLGYIAYNQFAKKHTMGAAGLENSTTQGSFGAGDVKAVRFSEVIGCDEVKEELQDLVHYLKNPDVPGRLGGTIPHGVLLFGPPGVGKTMLARAVATEAGVPFFYASGSGFDEVFVGVGSSRVRELFALARKNAPSVIFIDEIDAVGGSRKEGNSGSRQTINQLLSEMDGFHENEGVVVIGATNLGSVLDTALTRAGRFDSKVVLHSPDANSRKKLMKHYMGRVKCSYVNVDLEKLATSLFGYTGAAIENLVNQAALRAANTNSDRVMLQHLNWARDKIDLGRERKVHEDVGEQKNTAYHEAAHTAVAHFLGCPIYSVTIERRGHTGGHMKHLLTEDLETREDILKRLAVALAGKLGEEVVEGEGKHTMGCSSDYSAAQQMAARYISLYGFGQKLYAGRSSKYRPSNELRNEMDKEAKVLLDEAASKAKLILSRHSEGHKQLAEALLKKPTLSADEVKVILG
jgi:ATP-dependent metalloprotease FtsH